MKHRLNLRVAAFFILIVLFAGPAWADPESAGKIALNFVDVELPAFTKFISETTGKNFIFDDRLKGKITIVAPEGLSKTDVFKLFTSVLELKGFTLEPSGVNAYRIIPSSEAKQQNLPLQTVVNDSYVIRLIALKYISPDEALKFLSPIVSRDGYMSAFAPGNYLLVLDSGLNIEKILGILDIIDTPSIAQEADIIMLKYASAEDIARIINEGLQRNPARAGISRAIADTRLNAVILIGDAGDKDAMKKLIESLDVPSKTAAGGINVYFLEHASATDLADTLHNLFGGKPTAGPAQPAAGQAGRAQPAAGQAGFINEKISITPDKATNSLVIAASQSDYQNLVQIIKQLDKAKRQVFVQAMIAEVSLNNTRTLGSQWRGIVSENGAPIFVGGVGTITQSTLQSIITGLTGGSLGGFGNLSTLNITETTTDTNGNVTYQTVPISVPGYAAILNLQELSDIVNVLSEPQILTSDNQEAEIVVGQNVPMVSARDTTGLGTATTGLISSSIERKDVGIKLTITPHITEGDEVRLDVYQEISALVTPTIGDPTAILTQVGPTTTIRSTKTTVTVKDGHTVVIGGLISESVEKTTNKVPILGDIPIIGYLFKTESVTKQKTNVLVFLEPNIVRDAAEAEQISEKKKYKWEEKSINYKEGELLVRFKKGTSDFDAQTDINRMGSVVLKQVSEGLYLVKLKESARVPEEAKKFSALPQVEYAVPNYEMRLDDK